MRGYHVRSTSWSQTPGGPEQDVSDVYEALEKIDDYVSPAMQSLRETRVTESDERTVAHPV